MSDYKNHLNYKESGHLVKDEIVKLEGSNKVHFFKHDNVMDNLSIDVYTKVNKTGTKVTNFTVTKDNSKSWVSKMTFGSSVSSGVYYVSYYSKGDSNDADDINLLQDELSNINKFIDNSKMTVDDIERITNTRRHYPIMLEIPTYDNTKEAVHPDVLYIHNGFGSEKWRYWMAMTPLGGRDDQVENPSILVSHDGKIWDVPTGLTNPIVDTPPGDDNHNSDPCLEYYNGKLYLYYRETLKTASPRQQRIYLMKSSNGVDWSYPQTVLYDGTGNPEAMLSPTVRYLNGQFVMWYVEGKQSNSLKRRVSSDGEIWGSEYTCTTNGLPSGKVYWHIQVSKSIEGRLEMLLNSFPSNGYSGRLHYAYSYDEGKTWQTSSQFIDPLYPHEAQRFYRGTIRHVEGNPNLYEIWYSSLGEDNTYKISYMNAVRINEKLYPVSPSDRKYIFDAGLNVPDISAGTASFGRITVGGHTINGGKAPLNRITPLSGWYINPGMYLTYYKNGFDEVTLAGRILPGQTGDGTLLFTLPEGYRPYQDMIFRQRYGDVYVKADGDVVLYDFIERYVAIDGITFRTGI
ncbi:hypothetical protein [Halobacillus litoralis]|uniref:hypothetical protein n=1 Tax=Halobacillus litoralis TaxID=45668 RepID=UPI001CD5FA99|nr:hypothetical protein [Halobacillus litoralis]MCA1021665.1 hypothetical protein [Halobacillus litoralis]